MIVVVGASLGGLRAAEQLRANGYGGPITVIGDEPYLPYNRPPLSKELLSTPSTSEPLVAPEPFRHRASIADVDWLLGTKVVASDLIGQTLTLDNGSSVAYDGLVIASGLRPRRLDSTEPADFRHVLRNFDDFLVLTKALQPDQRVVIIGAGFIGCEVAAAALTRGCRVTIVEGTSGPMERSIGAELSVSMRQFLQREGVAFHQSVRVARLINDNSGHGGELILENGLRIAADVVVESIGSVPNTEWLEANNLDLSDGVLCDSSLKVVGVDHAVAVGDVARFPDPQLGGVERRVEHWATPGDTAKIAARTLLATINRQPIVPTTVPLPSFWTDLFGVRLQGVGSPTLATSTEVLEGSLDHPEAGIAVAFRRDSLLIAVVTVGLPSSSQLHYRAQVEAARDDFMPAIS